MADPKLSVLVRHLSLVAVGAVAVLLSGCVVAPVGAYDVGTPVAYPAYPAYGGYPVYGAPVYASPWYWGAPAVSLGFYGSFGSDRRVPDWGHRNPGGGHWAPGNRPGHRGSFRGGSRGSSR